MHRLGPVDELELGQRQNAIAVKRVLEGEVKARQGLDRGQPRHQQSRLDAPALAHREFFQQQEIESLNAVDLALLDAPQRRVEHLQGAGHPQADKAFADALKRGGRACHARPPVAAR
jgi:hypothetical protein